MKLKMRMPMIGSSKRWLSAVLAVLLLPGVVCAQSSREAIAQTLPRIVKIFGTGGYRNLHAYSTGFLVSPEGHIATVWSHVLDRNEVTVVLHNGMRYRATVLGMEPELDLAVLKVEAEALDLPYFDLHETTSRTAGTRILGFSNMFKVATGDEPVSVLHGVIAAKTKLSARKGAFEMPYKGPVYIVDAVTNNPGAGGGVITTRDGKLLGMIGNELRNSESNTWVNYAMPITELRDMIEQIRTGQFKSEQNKPELSESVVRYRPSDFGLVMVPDVVFRTPAYVDSVRPGSEAAKAGIRADDLILFVNGELIPSAKKMKAELGRLEAGDTLRLIVRRESKLVTLELPVAKKGRK